MGGHSPQGGNTVDIWQDDAKVGEANPLHTEDSGVHTNEERWRQIYHWSTDPEVLIMVNGVAGAVNFGGAVAAGRTRRIREITVRNPGQQNIVLHLRIQNTGNVLLSFDVTAQATREWSSQDGREADPAEQPQVYASNLPAGTTLYVSGSGLEWGA